MSAPLGKPGRRTQGQVARAPPQTEPERWKKLGTWGTYRRDSACSPEVPSPRHEEAAENLLDRFRRPPVPGPVQPKATAQLRKTMDSEIPGVSLLQLQQGRAQKHRELELWRPSGSPHSWADSPQQLLSSAYPLPPHRLPGAGQATAVALGRKDALGQLQDPSGTAYRECLRPPPSPSSHGVLSLLLHTLRHDGSASPLTRPRSDSQLAMGGSP